MGNLSEEHPKLYHYTNELGLYGIIKDQCLWATHYQFLNDSSELKLAREKLKNDLYPHVLEFYKKLISEYSHAHEFVSANGGLDAMANFGMDVLIEHSYKIITKYNEIYVLSFCAQHNDEYINENGLLSQWRAYGVDGGFAIVFDTQSLIRLINIESNTYIHNGYIFGDVIYSDEDDRYKSEFTESVSVFSQFSNELQRNIIIGKNELPDYLTSNKAFNHFANIITRYKHRGFKEEKEVRIAAVQPSMNIKNIRLINESQKNKKEKERKFRTKNGRLIPYVELFYSSDLGLPIEQIIVGPHIQQESRATTLKIMLRNTDIKVTVSEIPYSN